jgi:hypothetical protein
LQHCHTRVKRNHPLHGMHVQICRNLTGASHRISGLGASPEDLFTHRSEVLVLPGRAWQGSRSDASARLCVRPDTWWIRIHPRVSAETTQCGCFAESSQVPARDPPWNPFQCSWG